MLQGTFWASVLSEGKVGVCLHIKAPTCIALTQLLERPETPERNHVLHKAESPAIGLKQLLKQAIGLIVHALHYFAIAGRSPGSGAVSTAIAPWPKACPWQVSNTLSIPQGR